MILIEHPYRGHAIIVERYKVIWTATIMFDGEQISFVDAKGSPEAALAEAKRRVDLLVEKPR